MVKLYGKRFTTEENFRDTKDIKFGLGISATHIGKPQRRDRLLLVCAMAQALLTADAPRGSGGTRRAR